MLLRYFGITPAACDGLTIGQLEQLCEQATALNQAQNRGE